MKTMQTMKADESDEGDGGEVFYTKTVVSFREKMMMRMMEKSKKERQVQGSFSIIFREGRPRNLGRLLRFFRFRSCAFP